MHEGQLHLTPGQAAGVVARQFPAWAGLPVRPVASTGTVNLLFRIGDELVARFPLEPGDVDEKRAWLERELAAARALAGRLPVPTPEPVTLAEPDEVFPLPWAVHRWLPGTPAYDAEVAGSAAFARDLGTVVLALRAIDTGGRAFSGDARGGRLADHDEAVAAYLHDAEGMIDTDALRDLWARLRETPRDQPDVTTHGDLMPGNLLVSGGALAAVIDVGMAGPADPALDLQPAWNLLGDGRPHDLPGDGRQRRRRVGARARAGPWLRRSAAWPTTARPTRRCRAPPTAPSRRCSPMRPTTTESHHAHELHDRCTCPCPSTASSPAPTRPSNTRSAVGGELRLTAGLGSDVREHAARRTRR